MTIDTTPKTRRSENIASLAAALAKAQGAIRNAVKDSKNPFFDSTYADLGACWDACRAALSANGLAVIQTPQAAFMNEPKFTTYKTRKGDERVRVDVICRVTVTTLLAHSSGEWIENEIDTLLPSGDPQSIGSAITYLRRYALAPMVGVAPHDDDGNDASRHEGNGRQQHYDEQDQRQSDPPRPSIPPASQHQKEQAGVWARRVKAAANAAQLNQCENEYVELHPSFHDHGRKILNTRGMELGCCTWDEGDHAWVSPPVQADDVVDILPETEAK